MDLRGAHVLDDVDSNVYSWHHTLGMQPNQASSGAHDHEGVNSKRLLIANAIQEFFDGFIPWTPTWSTSGATQPTVGNGSLRGEYLKLGDFVLWSIDLSIGSTTNVGLGLWSFTQPPFTMNQTAPATPMTGFGVVDFNGGAGRATLAVRYSSTLIFRVVYSAAAPGTNSLTDTRPGGGAWASGDFMRLMGMFTIA